MRKPTPLETETDIKRYVYDLLARREYSRQQLEAKLTQRCEDPALINRVLEQFAQAGYQSDLRFVESHIRQRVQQGYGAKRIRYELGQKGIDSAIYSDLLEEAIGGDDSAALDYVLRKYGSRPCEDEKERAKRIRHLASRGFGFDEIQQALKRQSCLEED